MSQGDTTPVIERSQSIRCRICGMDTTDPEHKPAICEAVAHAVCKEEPRG